MNIRQWLDRLRGDHGRIQALQDALDKERARVDLVITRSLGGPERPLHTFGEDE